MAKQDSVTPLMRQYNAIKQKHPDAILLFRVGDFYETFGQDAIRTSEILGITLTKRANGSAAYVDLAGFPYHALDTYLPKLVRAGMRVAICDQLEDPKFAKKIVKRGITELVTPGVSLNDNVLENQSNNFLASVHMDKTKAGVAFLDISTGEFLTAEGSLEYTDKLLNSLQPKEVLFERGKQQFFQETFGKQFYTFKLDDWVFSEDSASDRLKKHFQTNSLKGFGIQEFSLGIIAAGAILHYLDITQHDNLNHINKISRIEEEKYVWLDKFTVRNLEIFHSLHEGAKTMFEVVDHTSTPMGSRMLKRWLALPMKNKTSIDDRLSVVTYFKEHDQVAGHAREQIKKIGDLERLVSKASVNRITPREIIHLKNALSAIQPIKEKALISEVQALKKLGEQLNPCESLKEKIHKEVQPDPPNQVSKGNVISEGVSSELDELRHISRSAKDYILQLQQREIEHTGIASLKVGYNNVFGYYIEVRNTHKHKVPEDWIRKQTLVSAERYITQELKELEEKILGAEDKILQLETRLFDELVYAVNNYIAAMQLNASLLAEIDCMLSFAAVSTENNYVRPLIEEDHTIDIRSGRHPVIEQQLPEDEEYIANDLYMDNDEQQIMVITGPNMSGKSALLRQTALIVLMAQIGCYVPANEARIGLVDKIFTRVGASDNISLGESTFMVEMNETASILNNLSDRSLVLLDEIGRGTSTYDGISIAWAIAEYLHEIPHAKAKTLFATHYHELNEMENTFRRIKNYNVSVKEIDDKVLFLRKLKRGGSAHSFGIHVARMAGMPKSIIKRAEEILVEMEKSQKGEGLSKPVADLGQKREGYQLSFFQMEDPVLKQIRDQIRNLDVNNLTPIEALNKLNEIKKITGL